MFLPKDARAASIGDFSFPFIQSEYTFLVPAASAIRQASDVDKSGIRIAAIRSHASTATLTSVIKQAEVVLEEGEQATFELLRAEHVHASRPHGSSFASFPVASGLASAWRPLRRAIQSSGRSKGRAGWLAYANEFVEEAKKSGLVQKAIDREGTSAFEVAPPGRVRIGLGPEFGVS